jgi:hypothetical protein
VFNYLYTPQYTPEPGLYGSLANTGDNCSGVLLSVGNVWEWAINNASQIDQATGYQYARADPVDALDPSGRGAILEYSIQLRNFALKIALHPANHTFLLAGRVLYCVHIMLVILVPGGSQIFRDQWPLWPLCWASRPNAPGVV